MSAAMKGAANPAQMIKAILEGASQAIAGLVKAGIGGAAEVARSVMSAASNAIMSIVRIVVDIVKAVLAGRKPDMSGGNDSQAQMFDAMFGQKTRDLKAQIEKSRPRASARRRPPSRAGS